MANSKQLKTYTQKRNFGVTPEPSGKNRPANGGQGPLSFVIQKHAARRLHYDFRLELDGVLLSWAVPKGPSIDPAEKRLAVQTEDHPIDYANFEGIIPEKEYGAGPVIVWDRGVYSPDEGGELSWEDRANAEERMRKAIKKGKISIFLEGEKLRGSWTLVRMPKTPKEWLMIKHSDGFAGTLSNLIQQDKSVVTGRTLEDIKDGKQPSIVPSVAEVALQRARRAKFPAKATPMLASLADEPFSKDGWTFEPKLDGIRALAFMQGGHVELRSRNAIDMTQQYPLITKQLSKYKDDLILDGEIVALDEEGKPSFQQLQQRLKLGPAGKHSIVYYVFDILHCNGKEVRGLPLFERREILKKHFIQSQNIRLVESFNADGKTTFKACIANGIEGVVGKRLDSLYVSGKRSRDWLKVKGTLSSEFLLCGYTPGTGSRAETFGSLILGEHDASGTLRYVGGVGTGFNGKTLDELLSRMSALKTKKCPFAKIPPGKSQSVWLKPQLVAEVKFAERTRDNQLRTPVFIRLRDDISAKEVKPVPIIDADEVPPGTVRVSGPLDGKQQEDVSVEGTSAEINDDILKQLDTDSEKLILNVEQHQISLSNLNKTFWPGNEKLDIAPFTKRDYLIYLTHISAYVLPHLKDRTLTLLRFPNGIKGGKFYQKHWEKGLPPFVETVRLFTEQVGIDQDYLLCNNIATLLWLGQIADLELHTSHTRFNPEPDAQHLPTNAAGSAENIHKSLMNYPDFLIFDLDPYLYSGKEDKGAEPELHGEGFKRTCEAAYWLKDLLDSLKIEAFVKTSGRTGLHIYVPIFRRLDYATVRALSEVLARRVLQDHPQQLTMEWSTAKRTGKVFLDHNMNARGKSLASIYSPRVADEATVSVPLEWSDLYNVFPTDFTIKTVPERLRKNGDLWKEILAHKNDMEKLLSTRGTMPGKSSGKK